MANWNKKENHRVFFEYLASILGVNQQEDWYKIKKTEVYKYGGRKLLDIYYDGSLYKVHRNSIDLFVQDLEGYLCCISRIHIGTLEI